MARPESFRGGHCFGNFVGSPRGKSIKVLPPPKQVIIPLHGATPTVEVRDRVRAGEVIGHADSLPPVRSSISGEVVTIDTDESVLIESDGKDEWVSLGGFERSSPEELSEILYEAGVGNFKLQGQEIERLLINAVETEPYLEGDNQLLEESLEQFVKGLEVLRRALGDIPVHVGINYKSTAYRRLGRMTEEGEWAGWLHIHPLLPKYPQGIAEILIGTIFGRTVQAMVLDVQMVVAAYEAVVDDKPYIERVISLGGSVVSVPGNFRVRIGAPIGELLEGRLNNEMPCRVIMGGPLRGEAVRMDMPITRDCSGITVIEDSTDRELFPFSKPGARVESYSRAFLSALRGGGERQANTKVHGGERECVRCGHCIEVCPVEIAPTFIARYSRHGMLKQAVELGIDQCIDCGLCSFVCTAKIPLSYQIKEGKRSLNKHA